MNDIEKAIGSSIIIIIMSNENENKMYKWMNGRKTEDVYTLSRKGIRKRWLDYSDHECSSIASHATIRLLTTLYYYFL